VRITRRSFYDLGAELYGILQMALWRPKLDRVDLPICRMLFLFGLALVLMNLSFYLAIERVPIGIAVALEFVGPLGLAVATSRRWLDLLWVILAGGGIVLLAPWGNSIALDLRGIELALAGVFWAAYILLSARVGQVLPQGTGLALAMSIGAVALLPIGMMAGGTVFTPQLLLTGFGVALLSSALPYSLELEALRSLPIGVFGILLSLEPVAAALVGLIMLQETLELRAIVSIVLITVAAAGAAQFRRG
jgi:inner membrane transporter RhtA